ncbi:F-actin-capping protein subunit beta [Zopfochytrium polystomum]|nr:F-actin-capping protein subunit beta [Zopfochytrium polystomum]
MADKFDVSLDLMRRLPPENVEENLAGLLKLVPDLSEDLLSAIDQPLKVKKCQASGKEYLLCDYNRDESSYRSPWSNEYEPPLPDGARPSAGLRKLEIAANDAFNVYREMYFEGGVSSVYMWDLEDGFAAVVLIKKVNDDAKKTTGTWDSIHVVEVQEKGRSAHYKLTSTIMLHLNYSKPQLGDMKLAGSLTRQAEHDLTVEDYHTHVANIGKTVEDMEIKMRNNLHEIYFGKTKDISNDLRAVQSLAESKKQAYVQAELVGKLRDRNV